MIAPYTKTFIHMLFLVASRMNNMNDGHNRMGKTSPQSAVTKNSNTRKIEEAIRVSKTLHNGAITWLPVISTKNVKVMLYKL